MKKLSILILSVLLIAGLFISCDNSSVVPSEELVTITFDDAQSRSLSAELEGFDKTKLFWAYTASKTDGGLSSGATSDEVWIHEGVAGLEGQIPGFSQGNWSFSLFAYKKIETTDASGNISTSYKKVYEGTNDSVTLKRDSSTSNKVTVTVSPIKDQNVEGTLELESNKISFKSQKLNDSKPLLAQKYKVTSLDGLTEYPMTSTTRPLVPGAYNVTVEFVDEANNIVYGSGTVVATIYSNLTTKVSGELVELLTHVEFDSDLNPDVITKTVSSDPISYTVTDPVKVEKVNGNADSKVSAVVTANAAKNYISSVANEIEGATTSNTNVVFSLNVNTTEASSTGVTYDIGMSAVAIIKKGDSTISQVTKQIESLTEAVTVQMQLQTGLNNVKVTHKLTSMSPLSSATDKSKNGYFYDINSGILTIRTDSFSPFKVEYELPASYAASVNDVKYTTLSAAVAAAKDGNTVKLVNDVVLNSPVTVTKTITLDLNGYSISSFESRALVVEAGTLTLTGTGTVESTLISINSAKEYSVIKVGSNNTSSTQVAAGLVVGENVTVKSTTSYGIVVMGTGTVETVTIKGEVITQERACVSGNGSKGYGGTTITIDGTVTLNESSTRGENVNAIYHPQSGNLTINGTVNGGIEAKAGYITITEGAKVYAESGITNHTPYSNGCSTQGYAIAAVNNKAYSGEPIFIVNGGVIEDGIVIVDDDNNPNNNNAKIYINGGSFTDLDSAINYASSGATIKLAADVTGKGIGSKDAGKATYRDSLIIDFNGHTYTMNDPAVGSTGTKSQAMHWGKSLGSVTLKNGTFKVAENTQSVKMAMQNYINFTAEDMTFDFSEIPVTSYSTTDDFDPETGIWKEYSGLEVPMFNNNSGKMILKNTEIVMPSNSTKGLSADGDGVDIIDCTIDGYINLQGADSCVRIKNSTVKGVVPYFENGSKVISTEDEEGYSVYRLVGIVAEDDYSIIEKAVSAAFYAQYSDANGVTVVYEGEVYRYSHFNRAEVTLPDNTTCTLFGKIIQANDYTVIIDFTKETQIGNDFYSILVEVVFDEETDTQSIYANVKTIMPSQTN